MNYFGRVFLGLYMSFNPRFDESMLVTWIEKKGSIFLNKYLTRFLNLLTNDPSEFVSNRTMFQMGLPDLDRANTTYGDSQPSNVARYVCVNILTSDTNYFFGFYVRKMNNYLVLWAD